MNEQQVAENIASQLIDNIGYCSDDKPLVHQNDKGYWCVSWEGLSNWPQNDSYTLYEEAGLGEMGIEYESKLNPYFKVPVGFAAEPYNHITLTIYGE